MRAASLVVLSLLLGSSLATGASAADAKSVTHEELGGLIRDYLNKNPEVIIESVALYQKKEQEAGLKETRAAILANKDAVYNNPAIPAIGDKGAKVSVVEFFDYNCSACKYMFTVLDRQVKAKDKDVRIIFMESNLKNSLKLDWRCMHLLQRNIMIFTVT